MRLVRNLLLAVLVWACVFLLCVSFLGDGLTLYLEQPPEAEGLELRMEPEGIVRLDGDPVLQETGELALHVFPVERGETQLTIIWKGLGADSLYADVIPMRIRVLPLGIVTDSVTMNFTGWEYMVFCLTALCFSFAVLLFLASQQEQRRACFSYRAIRYLGLAIFFLAIGLFRVGDLLAFARGESAGTVWSLLVGMISSAQTFLRWSAWVLGAFALVIGVSNLVLMRREGFRPANMLGLAVSAFIVGGAILGIRMSWSHFTFPLRNALCNVYAGLFVYFECLLAATVDRAILAGRHEPKYDKDYVIILGCKIRPDGSLYPLIRGRVDRAIAFAGAQVAAGGKPPVLIPSGGKGQDEPMAEAEAMAQYLRSRGIPENQILMENRSRTTKENLSFSRQLIAQAGAQVRVAFATSSYHVCRGGILAEEMGWSIDGMGSRTKWYFWPNAFLREFIGLMAESRMQQLAAVVLIAAVSAGLTLIV